MAEVEEEEEASTQLSTLLPPAEVQQRENKAWQDVFDTPANRSAETVGMLLEVRQGCEGPGSRLDGAEKMKGEANSAFEKGEHALALRSYLMALWLLDLDDPPVPKLLAEPELPQGAALLRMLTPSTPGASASAAPSTSASGPESDAAADAVAGAAPSDEQPRAGEGGGGEGEAISSIRALGMALRLNVAAAALKLEQWPAARLACEIVLENEPTHAKALYRLAKAHEGAGDLSAALAVLSSRLLKVDPQHKEASRLARTLRDRAKHERQMFGGLFDRAQGEGGDESGLYSDAALRSEARRRKEEKDALLKLENVAKLPTEMWAETMGDLDPSQRAKLTGENRELASQMEDGAWQKHMANMTPEAIEEAKQAVALHKAREELRAQGLLPEEDEGEEDEDDLESKFDRIITYVAVFVAAAALIVAVALGIAAQIWPGDQAAQSDTRELLEVHASPQEADPNA